MGDVDWIEAQKMTVTLKCYHQVLDLGSQKLVVLLGLNHHSAQIEQHLPNDISVSFGFVRRFWGQARGPGGRLDSSL